MSAGSISFDDITLAWTLAGIPTRPVGAELAEPGDARPATDRRSARAGARRAVRVGSVSATRAARHDVLSGLDLELRAGTSTAIVGVNGAGKSTLVSLLSRLRDPTAAGSVDGRMSRTRPGRWQRASR